MLLITVEEEQGKAVHFAVKAFFKQLYITNKMELFSFKSGCAERVAKFTKTD